MKKIWAILLMSAAAPAVAASVYECSGKNGQTTYTQNPSGSHCRPADKCAMAMSAIMSAISSAFRGWSKPCKTRVRNWSKPKAGK